MRKLIKFLSVCVFAIALHGASFAAAAPAPAALPATFSAAQMNTLQQAGITKNAAGRFVSQGKFVTNASVLQTLGLTAGGTPTAPWYKTVAGKFKGRAGLFRGLGIVGGVAMILPGTAGMDAHSWGDVISGAIGGATAGGTIGSIVPGIGTAIGLAGGTVIGTAVGGAKFFSESGGDCVNDPALGVFTCCNTVFNKGERAVDIGGQMFCDFGGVRYCVNGKDGSITTNNIFKNDQWGQCFEQFCEGVPKPVDMTGVLTIAMLGDQEVVNGVKINYDIKNDRKLFRTSKACWAWICDDENGYAVGDSGDRCVRVGDSDNGGDNGGGGAALPGTIDEMIQRLESMRARMLRECS